MQDKKKPTGEDVVEPETDKPAKEEEEEKTDAPASNTT
jgi:hypothetical protein